MYHLLLKSNVIKCLRNNTPTFKTVFTQLNAETMYRYDPVALEQIDKIEYDYIYIENLATTHKQVLLLALKEHIEKVISEMLEANPNRIYLFEKYRDVINESSKTEKKEFIDKTLGKLLALSDELIKEQSRYIREGFDNEEQLYIYDLLKQESITSKDYKCLKVISKMLYEISEEMATKSDYMSNQLNTSANIQIAIQKALCSHLPKNCYSNEAIFTYAVTIFQYLMRKYSRNSSSEVHVHIEGGTYIENQTIKYK